MGINYVINILYICIDNDNIMYFELFSQFLRTFCETEFLQKEYIAVINSAFNEIVVVVYKEHKQKIIKHETSWHLMSFNCSMLVVRPSFSCFKWVFKPRDQPDTSLFLAWNSTRLFKMVSVRCICRLWKLKRLLKVKKILDLHFQPCSCRCVFGWLRSVERLSPYHKWKQYQWQVHQWRCVSIPREDTVILTWLGHFELCLYLVALCISIH